MWTRAWKKSSEPSRGGWSIEVLFKASEQILDIQGPQHYCQQSVQKVAPWVWGMQTLVSVWYILAGRYEPEAEEIRQHMGEWDSEWSLANMLRVLRRAILNAEIKKQLGVGSADERIAGAIKGLGASDHLNEWPERPLGKQ